MPNYISKIKLPSGSEYEIKDAVARQLIANGVSFIIAWNGSAAPVIANIPAGVSVSFNGTSYTGTLAAGNATAGAFYLVKSSTLPSDDNLDVYDEYVVIANGNSKTWEKIGDTRLNLGNLGDLAYKSSVTLNKGAGDNVLGEATTFALSSDAVTHGLLNGHTQKVLGSGATFNTVVTPSQTTLKPIASLGDANKVEFSLGSGDHAETLVITATAAAPSYGSDISVVTGIASTSTTTSNADSVDAVTSMPASKVGTAITVGTNDKVKVAKYNDLSVSAS